MSNIRIEMDSKMSNQDYVRLAGDMILYNNQLVDKLNDWSLDQTPKLLIMGPTKSGKSTFMSRLCGDMDPETFMEMIQKFNSSNEAKAEIYGIRIGAAMGSTTLVPNYRKVHRFDMIDLAGFLDTNRDKAPIITILNYKLFSKLSRAVLLVVLNLNELSDDATFNGCMSHYVTEFTNLFTENNFNKCLESSYFIMTRVDDYMNKHELTDVKKAREKVRADLSKQAMKMESQKSSDILKRMFRHMMLADYTSMTRDQMLAGIGKLLDDSMSICCNELVFDSVTMTNDLCNKALEIIVHFNKKTIAIRNDMDELILKFQKEKKACDRLMSDLTSDLRESQKKTNDLQLAINDAKMKISNWESSIEILPIEIKELMEDLQNVNQQYNRTKKTISNMTMLEVTTLKSIPHIKWTRPVNRIQVDIDRSKGAVRPPICFCLTQQVFSDFKSKIDNCQSLPEVDELKLPKITMTSNDYKMTTRIDSIYINITHKEPFVILVMSEISIAKAGNLNMFLDFFNSNISKMEHDIESKQQTLINNTASVDKYKNIIVENKSTIQDVKNTIGKLEDDITKLELKFKALKENCIVNLNKVIDDVDKLLNGDLFNLTSKLSSILTEANVDVSKFSNFQLIKSELESVKNTSKEAIMRFSNFNFDLYL